MNRYEKETQHLFVSSERLFGSGGTQNHFKVELNDAPFHNDDSSILRLSLQQFNMCKNFANVNYTNNKIRMFMKTFTNAGSSFGFSDIDETVTIPYGNYTNHKELVEAFGAAVKAVLLAHITGDDAALIDVDVASTTNGNTNNDNKLKLTLSLKKSDGAVPPDYSNVSWDANSKCVPRFVCLNVPNGVYSYNTIGGANVLGDEQFNDSYILLGGRRIEEFEGIKEAPIWDMTAKVSLSSIAVDNVCHIQSWYPMNNALHTCEYVYITSPQCHSQASNNLVEMSSSHAHKFISSSIIGKAMRVTNPSDGSVFYKIVDQSPFFTNITSSSVSTLIFELRDSRGRLLPYEPPSKTATTTLEAYSGDDQVRDGNTAVDMTLLMEKFVGNAPQKLQGYPAPNPQPNPNMRSNLTIPRKMC